MIKEVVVYTKRMELPLGEHLSELRRRLITILAFLLIFFVVGFSFSGFFIRRMINDLVLIENVKVVSLTPIEYILAQVKVGFIASLAITLPVLLHQLLAFIAPGLNKKEKRAVRLILPPFILLFLMGVVFAYFMFLPVAIYVLGSLSGGAIQNVWSIDKLIDFVLLSCLSCGLIFELPLLLVVLGRLGVVDGRLLRKYRAHIYVLIFLFAGVVTPPPDIVTQLMVALPLVVMYEISLLMLPAKKEVQLV